MQDYELSKLGDEETTTYTTGGTPAKLELVSWSSGEAFKKARFLIRCTTDFYMQLGNGSHTLDKKFPLPHTMIFPVDVDTPDERYLKVDGVSTAGTVYVKRVSDLVSAYGVFTVGS